MITSMRPLSLGFLFVTPFALATLASPVWAAKVAAEAQLIDAQGASVGKAKFLQTKKGVRVSVEVNGLTPGEHGIHIHENGLCDTPDFKTAGAHFNPTQKSHGLTHEQGAHAGDLPNLKASAKGRGRLNFVATGATLEPSNTSLLKEGGTALVIHAKADDGKTQPSGDSGDRVVCGVIRAIKK